MSQPFRLSVRIRSSAFRGQLLESRSFPLARPCCVPSASPGSSKVSRASISVSTEGFFTINPRSQQRTFKSTARNSKKPKTGYTDAPIDPFDVTSLKAKVEEINEKLRIDLSKLRGGGRFDHTVVEQLRVQAQKGKKETVKLGTLAQVIPKSRLLNVVVGDPEHVKPVTSAIAASKYSLVPQQPTADAPTTVIVPIPPPTGDARKATLDSAKKAADGANAAIKMARQQHHKMLRNLQLESKVRPDDFRKANSVMEKVIEAANKSLKTIRDNAKNALESS